MIEGEGRKFAGEPEELSERSRFPYSSFTQANRGEFVQPDLLSYSDYGGSLVERSNVEEFMEQFADSQGAEWWELYGSHGTRAVVVRRDADERVPEIGEFFEGLANYPIANEDRHSELEMQQRDNDWASYGHDDFKRWLLDEGPKELVAPYVRGALAEQYPSLDPVFDQLPDETMLELSGFDADEWDVFIETLSDGSPTGRPNDPFRSALGNLWFELMSHGSGGAEEIEGQSTVFLYAEAFTGGYMHGERGVGLEDMIEILAARNPDAILEPTKEWMLQVAGGIGDEHRVRILCDYLLEHGGVWDATAEKLLKTHQLGRYAA